MLLITELLELEVFLKIHESFGQVIITSFVFAAIQILKGIQFAEDSYFINSIELDHLIEAIPAVVMFLSVHISPHEKRPQHFQL